jgi:surface antigen
MLARRAFAFGSLALLAGCGGSRGRQVPQPEWQGGDISCVPYARARSGIQLRGDAWQWWDQAAGRYPRSPAPRPGSVLVLARTGRMPQGHVAVVSRIVSSREIRVDHANWASGAAKGRVATDQPVRDVSPRNDWSEVRVWYPRIQDFGGTVFPAHGFILPGASLAAR